MPRTKNLEPNLAAFLDIEAEKQTAIVKQFE